MGCFIYYRTQPKVAEGHPDFHRLFQEGDVICVTPDQGWDIGRLDMANPEVVVLHCTNMEQADAELEFMAKETGNLRENPNLRRRIATLSRAGLPANVRNRIQNRTPINPSKAGGEPKTWAEVKAEFDAQGGPITVNRNALISARQVKPTIPNPFIVGRDPFVVG